MKTFTKKDLEKNNKDVLASNYGNEFKIIETVLKKYPNNTDKSIIALKIALIDITNFTNINRYKSMITLNELVDVIYNIKDFDKKISDYSIYVSVLKDLLPEYINNISKYKIDCWRKTMDYEAYHNCITEILKNNNIKIKDCRRKFDRFIWWSYKRK